MSNKLKYYILTSKNLKNLKRHFDPQFSNIPKDRGVVVINTLDKEYEGRAVKWCEEENIEYHITPSNGTAARGKNCLLDVFLKSDNEYIVQIDGDDFLTPHGVWMYNHIAKSETPPDGICLKCQFSVSLFFGEEFIWEVDPETTLLSKMSYFFMTDWDRVESHSLVDGLLKHGVSRDKAHHFDEKYHEFYRLQKKYCEDNESHCRVTWISRKAAMKHKFPEHLRVGEDTVFYFLLKHDGLVGDLNVYCNDDRPPTYVYDQTIPGVVRTEINDGKDWSWMDVYIDEIYKMESKSLLHETDLPLLKINYPEDYTPNILNLPVKTMIPFDDQRGIPLPLNASQKTIGDRIKKNDFFYYSEVDKFKD